MSANDKQLNVIDLFCGCGGFSQGFKQAGFSIALGLDNWEDAINTYKKNFPTVVAISDDITKVSGKEILSKIKNVDVVVGGPPCQGFSLSGKRLLDDPRNVLYKSFVNIVKETRPKVFVMENVLGLVRLFNGKVKENVVNDFTELGYNVNMQVLSAEQYGVPQQRKRVFFVGLDKEIFGEKLFNFPNPTHGAGKALLPIVTTEDALSDLDFIPDDKDLGQMFEYERHPKSNYQQAMRKDSPKVLNHSATLHTDKTKSIIAMVPDGANYKTLPKELWQTRKVNIAWTRMNSKKPCFTIDTGHNHHFHYRANRVPTARESARIQSFPDNFEFLGIKTSQLKQVGNAVPPLLAQAVAEQIKKTLKEGKYV